jgi:hypothetical protein
MPVPGDNQEQTAGSIHGYKLPMNDRKFKIELEATREVFARFSPKQVKRAMTRLRQDLRNRPPEVGTGISVGDRFVKSSEWTPGTTELWVLRPRILNALDRLIAGEAGLHVGLVRPIDEHAETISELSCWAGWMPVVNAQDLTDQEWERVRDGLEFKQVTQM